MPAAKPIQPKVQFDAKAFSEKFKGKAGKAVRKRIGKAKEKFEPQNLGEKIGAKIGEKLKQKAQNKLSDLAAKGLKKILGIKSKAELKKEARQKLLDEAADLRRNKKGLAGAAAMMGHAGLGIRHKITDADARARSKRLAGARRIWKSLDPALRLHNQITKTSS